MLHQTVDIGVYQVFQHKGLQFESLGAVGHGARLTAGFYQRQSGVDGDGHTGNGDGLADGIREVVPPRGGREGVIDGDTEGKERDIVAGMGRPLLEAAMRHSHGGLRLDAVAQEKEAEG